MKKKILIIRSNYYNNITRSLSDKIYNGLIKTKYSINEKIVSGAFEIPLAISQNIRKFDAFIAVGCVIKGKTDHYDYICRSVFDSLLYLMIEYKKPIANSILTTNNQFQAKSRILKKSKEVILSIKSFI